MAPEPARRSRVRDLSDLVHRSWRRGRADQIRLLAFGMTLGTIAFLVAVCALVVVAPRVPYGLVGDGVDRWALEVVRRLLVLLLLVTVALPVVYHVSPSQFPPRMSWVSPSALVAAGLWLLASGGFSLYATTLGSYAQTYGVFGGVVVVVLWLWITVYAILLGAEIQLSRGRRPGRATLPTPQDRSRPPPTPTPTPAPGTTRPALS